MKSDRSINKTPNDKMIRYLQRIQKIVGPSVNTKIRNSSPSPIASKIKTQNIKTLDHFLKFQLTFKILNNYMQKMTMRDMRTFFNNIRYQYLRLKHKQPQTVYRFVSIQKQRCTHNLNNNNSRISNNVVHYNIDRQIAMKLMLATLKSKFKRVMSQCFNLIMKYNSNYNKIQQDSKVIIKKDQVQKSQRNNKKITDFNSQHINSFIKKSKINNKVPKLNLKLQQFQQQEENINIIYKPQETQRQSQNKAQILLNNLPLSKQISKILPIVTFQKLYTSIYKRRLNQAFYSIKYRDINILYQSQIKYLQDAFYDRNLDLIIGRYISYSKWKYLHTIIHSMKKYKQQNNHINRQIKTQIIKKNQTITEQTLKSSTENFQNTKISKKINQQKSLKQIFQILSFKYKKYIFNFLLKVKLQQYQNMFFNRIDQISSKHYIILINLFTKQLSKIFIQKQNQFYKQGFKSIKYNYQKHLQQKDDKKKTLSFFKTVSQKVSKLQVILNQNILFQYQTSFQKIKKQSFQIAQPLEKISILREKIIKSKFINQMKKINKMYKLLLRISALKDKILLNSYNEIKNQAIHSQYKRKKNQLQSKLKIFSKINKKIINQTIYSFINIKHANLKQRRQKQVAKQNTKNSHLTNYQISQQTSQFLLLRQNSQNQYQLRLSKLKQTFYNKSKA